MVCLLLLQKGFTVIVGVHESISHSGLKAKYPGVQAVREFVSGVQSTSVDLRTKYAALADPAWAEGLIPFISIKTDPATTGTGSYDSRFRDLALYLAGKPSQYLIWYHEPEDNMSGTTFAKAFKRVRDVMKAANPNVKVVYSAMAYQWGSSRSSTADPAPWRVDADLYCADTYSGGSRPVTAILPEHTYHMRWYNELVAKTPGASAKWGVTERGFEGTSKVDSQCAFDIDRESDWLASLTSSTPVTFPQVYLYWNSDGAEGDPTLINGPLATEAVKRLIARFSGPPPVTYVDCPTCVGQGHPAGKVPA